VTRTITKEIIGFLKIIISPQKEGSMMPGQDESTNFLKHGFESKKETKTLKLRKI